jgi:hypothetical protein
MYFMRDIAKAIRNDWGARAAEAKPFVFMNKVELMAPWCPSRKAPSLRKADYVVVWDEKDPAVGSRGLREIVLDELHTLKHAIATVRYEGQVVARVYRANR